MSADNILITLKSPRRDGEGFEWYVLDVSFSGYDCKVWDGGLSDELILAINDAYLRRDFYTEDDAEGFAEKYHDENIVEYGGTQHETNFPFPTAGEILAAQRRWEADRLRRECAEQVTRLQSVIRYLVEFEIKYAGTTLDHFRECLHNPEFESWYETIRERDIPEAEDKLVDLCFQLVAARRELEVAEHELAAFGEITIKIRTESRSR